MSVVNVKVAYIRPEYENLSVWCADPNNVYIGRRGVVFINGARYPTRDSLFANPYKINAQTSRDEVIEKYTEYIKEKLKNNKDLVEELLSLDGKTLGCWCAPGKCHGDVLLNLIEEYKQKDNS